jgi:lipopolysaccharide biosynthesis glycosyltransferase
VIIVSAADERFVPHYATTLHSGWFHNREAAFHLLDCGITEETRGKLREFAATHGMRLTIVTVDTALFHDLPITRDDLTAATFARLRLPAIFPADCDKVIFLDADCVVTGDLRELWETDISDHLIAGVQDERALREDGADGILRDRSTYINSGVMLINLRAWREENFGDAVISVLRQGALRSHEQSAINIVAAGRIKTVPEIWNLMLHTMDGRRLGAIKPRIVHCTGNMKPWLAADAPLASIYRGHRNLTPFPLDRPLPPYRSRLHVILSLMALRPKYWRRLIVPALNDRDFAIPYMASVGHDKATIRPSTDHATESAP